MTDIFSCDTSLRYWEQRFDRLDDYLHERLNRNPGLAPRWPGEGLG